MAFCSSLETAIKNCKDVLAQKKTSELEFKRYMITKNQQNGMNNNLFNKKKITHMYVEQRKSRNENGILMRLCQIGAIENEKKTRKKKMKPKI